mmetsp:Transcript_18173/g.28764  ORF Transcript_18173/g.28764 Transcript_18173/m.28764 type:complete len:357 (+) Transcript_18173:147-1217(+)
MLYRFGGANQFIREIVFKHVHVIRIEEILQFFLCLNRERNIINHINIFQHIGGYYFAKVFALCARRTQINSIIKHAIIFESKWIREIVDKILMLNNMEPQNVFLVEAQRVHILDEIGIFIFDIKTCLKCHRTYPGHLQLEGASTSDGLQSDTAHVMHSVRGFRLYKLPIIVRSKMMHWDLVIVPFAIRCGRQRDHTVEDHKCVAIHAFETQQVGPSIGTQFDDNRIVVTEIEFGLKLVRDEIHKSDPIAACITSAMRHLHRRMNEEALKHESIVDNLGLAIRLVARLMLVVNREEPIAKQRVLGAKRAHGTLKLILAIELLQRDLWWFTMAQYFAAAFAKHPSIVVEHKLARFLQC